MNTFEELESEIRGLGRLYPTVFASASNARLTDESGQSYIDFFAGAGVLNFGHNNEGMKKALVDFIERDGVAHSLDMYTVPKRDFLRKFSETILAPRGMKHRMQFMGPTGTNAVEAALKLARKVTGRSEVVAFAHGFHGMTLGSLACTGNRYFRAAAGVGLDNILRQPFGCESLCAGCNLGCGTGSVERLRALYADSSSGLAPPAAFLVETVQAEGGVRVADKAWIAEIQSLARDLGALLIIDDIQAGCGRTGSYFSFDDLDVDPDIITLAKGIGGFGTPLAMNLVKPEHDAHWQPGEHTGTFRGQGLSFVAGVEALRYFDDDRLMTEVKRKGVMMREQLEELCTRAGDGGFQVRGKGMLQAIDLRDGALARKVIDASFAQGLLIGGCGTDGTVLKLIPPLTIPEADLQAGLSILTGAISQSLEQAA